MKSRKAYIPVFGDIHGNIEGLFNTLKYLQQKHEISFMYAFQLGDLGFFKKVPDTEKIRGDLELGVHKYLNDTDYAENFFYSDVDTKILFIRGNHEDQKYLKHASEFRKYGTILVDEFHRFVYFPDGRAISMGDRDIAAFGGISKESRPKKYQHNPLIAYSEKGLDELLDWRDGIDVLLTHQGPSTRPKGDLTIDTLIQIVKPKVHIHGHSHVFAEPFVIEETQSYCLANMPPCKRPFLVREDFYGFLNLIDLSFTQTIP